MLPGTHMTSRLLKYLSLSIWLISATNFLFAQETTDNSTYYYNNFETAVAGNITSLGAASKGNANRISTATTIDASTTSPLDGSVSLASIKPATNAIGTIRWNFVGNGTSGVDLTQNDWEWDFVYENTSSSSNDDPDQMAVGKNAWRYWLYSSTYNGNSTQGFYVSHVGGNLVLRYRYTTFGGANFYNTILTAALPNNQTPYIIKIQRLKGGTWAIYMDPFTPGMTTAQTIAATTTGTTGSGFSTYYYSYLETTATTNARFQWDDFNMYTRVLQFTAVGANSVSTNNITPSPLYPGQTNVIMYGLKILSRGNFNINQLVLSTTGAGFDGYFNNAGTLYFTTNPFYTIGTSVPVTPMTLTGNSASNYSFQGYVASSGNTDGTYSNPGYTFITGNVNNTLNYGNPPTGTIAFTGITTLTGNANGNGTAGTIPLNYSIIGSGTGNTMTFLNAVVPPTAPNISGCGPGTYTITASGGNPAGGTYNWYAASSGGSALQSSTSNTYSPTVSSTTTYYVSYTVGGATSTRTAVTVTINPIPASTFTVTSPVNVGVSSTITYTGSDPASSTYTWNFNGGTIISGSGRGPYSIQWSTPGTKSVSLSVTNSSGCTSVVNTQTVTVQPVPPTATNGSACGPGTYTITASGGNPAGGTYNWYAASSGGTALQSAASTTYTTTFAATTTYYVSYTAGGIESNRTAVFVTINPVPTSTFTATSPVDAGANSTITYTGSDPASSTYNWNFNGGTIVSGSGRGPYTVQWAASGIKSVTLSVTNSSGCTSVVTTQPVTVQPVPPIAPNVSACGPGTYTIIASGGSPAGGTYNWYAASSGGTALQSSTSTSYSTTYASTTNYYVSYTTGGIESNRTTVTVTVYPVPSSTFTATSPVNAGSNSAITYTGGDPASSTYNWNFNGGTIVSGSGQGPYTVQWATPGTKSVTLSVTNASGCTSLVTTQPVTVQPLPPTAANVSNCGPGTVTITASGGAPAGGTYNWYAASSGGSPLQSSAATSYTTPSISVNTTYYVSYTSGGVESNRTAVTVTIKPAPVIAYATPQTYIYGTAITALTPTNSGAAPTGYSVSPALPAGLSFSTTTGTISGTATVIVPANNYTVTATSASGCTAMATINITVTPPAPTATGGSVCGSGTVTLTASGGNPAGGTYNWYVLSSGGVASQSSTATTFTTPSISTTTTYYVSYTSSGVESNRTAVTATVNPLPASTFTATSPVSVGGSSTITYTGSDPASSTYNWNFNGGTIVSGSGQGPYAIQWSISGNKSVTLSVTNAIGCTSVVTTQTVVVQTVAPTATGGSTCGPGTVTLTASGTPAGGTYNWYVLSSGGVASQSSTATSFTTPSISTTTTYYVSYTSSGIESNRTAVTATVNPLPVISYATPQTYTVGTAITNLPPTVSGGTPTGYAVSPALPAGLGLSTTTGVITGTATVAAAAANYVVTATTASGCTGSATVNLTVTPAAPTATGGSTCGPGTVTLTASGGTPAGGTYNWYVLSSGGVASQSSTATSFTTPSISSTTTYYVSYTSSGVESNRTAVTATVNPVPSSTFTATSPVGIGVSSTITYTGGDPASSIYNWNFNGGTIVSGSGQGPYSIQWASSGTKTVTLSVTNASGCSSAVSSQAVGVQPAAPTATGGSTCGPGTVTLSASGGTPAGGTYNWYSLSSGGVALQSSTSTTYTTASISATNTYYVSYTAGGIESNRTAVTATVNPVPSSAFTASSPVVAGASSTITYAGGDPATSTYNWNFNGGTVVSGSGQGPYSIQWATPGTKTITLSVTNASGCTSTVTSQAVTVQPAAPIAVGGSNCGAGGVTLTASGGTPAGGTYNWYAASSGGVALQSSTANTYAATVNTTTTYYVSYTTSGAESNRTPVTATINAKPVISQYPGSAAANYISAYVFSGNANDVSGNANNGTVQNGAALSPDRYGAGNSAYTLNGTNQYISTTKLYSAPSTFSISAWFNTTTTVGGSIVGFGNSQTGTSGTYDRNLYMNSVGQLYFGNYSGTNVQTINSTSTFNDGNWHHVVGTFSSTTGLKLYVDGILLVYNTTFVGYYTYNGYWRIGNNNLGGYTSAPASNYFPGMIDDITIYNREVTAAEVYTLNGAGSPPACVGGTMSLQANTVSGATYAWTGPGGFTSTLQNPTIAGATLANVGTYTVTVTGSNGCSSQVTATTSLSATPTSSFSVPAAVYPNTSAYITYSGSDPATSTFNWNFGSGTIVSGSGIGPYKVKWASAGNQTVTLTVTNANGCSSSTTSHIINVNSTAWYSTYVYRKKITLDATKISGTGNLPNFPVLLKVVDPDLIYNNGSCTNKIQSPALNDLAFVDGNSPQSNELPYQIDTFDGTTGTLLVWVQQSSISSTGDGTSIYYYYGSTTPPAHLPSTSTWGADYKAVYHFNEKTFSSATGAVNESTANAFNATTSNMTAASLTTGQIAGAYSFSNSFISTGSNLDMLGDHTISAWVNTNNTSIDEKVLTNQNSSNKLGYKLGSYYNQLETESVTQGASYSLTRGSNPMANLAANTWYYVQGVVSGTQLSVYLNGVQYATTTITVGLNTAASTFYIGVGESGNLYYWSGLIDEVRVSNVAKTTDWIKTEYNNQLNPTNTGTAPFISSIANVEYNITNYDAGYSPGSLIYTWTGSAGTGVASTANWNLTSVTPTIAGIVPTGVFSSIAIQGGATNYPQLTSPLSVYSVAMGSGSQLNLNGNVLNVACDITNSSGGQILYGNNYTSGITWNGSLSVQHYNGSTTASTGQTGNMTVNNSAGGTVTITGGGLDIYNTLTMVKGNLAVGASPAALTLKSSAAQSASVAAIPTGTAITGNVTVERFVTGGTAKDPTTGRWTYRSYRLMSSPVNEGTDGSGRYPYSINYLNASTIITGTTSAYGTTPGNPSLYVYNEGRTPSNTTFTSGTFDGVTNISSTTAAGTISTTDPTYPTGKMYVGDGFMMYFRGDNINNLSGVPSKTKTPFVAPENVVFSTTGNLNQGTYSVTPWTGTSGLMYTTSNAGNLPVRGYNLVGNPYASSIDWSLFSNSNPSAAIYGVNVNPSIYILNPRTSNYDVYSASTGISTGNASNVIPSGAGFYVQANNTSAALTFKEAAKTSAQVTGNNLLMGRADNQSAYNSYMRLKLVTDTINNDDIVIGFNSSSTMKYNPAEDAKYLGLNAIGALASISSDSVKASVKWLSLPKAKEQRIIPLDVTGKTSGIHTLERTELKQLPAIYEVWLMDKYKSDSLDIKHNSTYAFNLELTDTASYGSNRFRVVIRQDPALAIHLLNFTAAKSSNGAQLVWKTENEQNYTNFTVERSTDNGKTFQVLGGLSSAGQGSYSFLDKDPQVTVDQYRLKIEDLDGTISYSKVIPLMYSSLSNSIASSGITIYPNPATSNVNLYIVNTAATSINSNVTYKITVVNSTGTIIKTDVSSKPTWQYSVGSLIPGTYMIQVVNNNDKSLVGKGKFVKL